tara:strand:+ start:2570 stop:2998 length:429 start_codon:yes stop_codon:yes gene_type:complete
MNYNKTYVKQLDEIISAGLKELPIPYEKGNSIRIKHMVIRKHSNGYRVFDCRCNKHIETVFSKTAAVAIAKGLAVDKNYRIQHIIALDHDVCKNYNDALFAKRSMKNAENEESSTTAEIKYDIAVDRAWSCLDQLEKLIFDK